MKIIDVYQKKKGASSDPCVVPFRTKCISCNKLFSVREIGRKLTFG